MENKYQDPGSVYSGGDAVQPQAPSLGSDFDQATNVGALSSYDSPSATPQFQAVAPEQSPNLFMRLIKRADVILAVLLLLSMIGVFVITSSKKDAPTSSSNFGATEGYETQVIPLDEFKVTGRGVSFGSHTVVINGLTELNGGLVVTPSLQPIAPKAGQIYFDQSSNQFAYYNGTEFVTLGSGIGSIGNITGQVTLGGGLAAVGNQLINAGVISLGGQGGAIVLGNGLNMAGNTLQNTGVLNVIAGTDISVTNDGNGNFTVNNVGAGSGNVSTAGGVAGTLPLFTSAQNIEESIVTQSGLTVTITGDLSVVTGGLSLSNALTVSNGGTGTNSLAANGVLVGNGTAAITSVTSGAAGLCLVSTAGAPTFAACPSGSGVTSLNSLTGALNIANASAAGSTITIDDASTVAKGIASFNSTNFSVASGAVNTIQNINSAATPTFAGLNTNTITPSATLTVGSSAQTLVLQGDGGTVITATSGANTTTVGFNAPSADANINFPALSAGSYDVCTTSGNCLGGGGGGANTALSNLASVAINTTLLPGSAGGVNLGSATLPFGDIFLAGTSGTPGTNNFRITGASTSGTRTITLPNASGTVCIDTGNCAGTGGGVTVSSAGTVGTLPVFTAAQTIADSLVSQSGGTVTVNGHMSLSAGNQYQVNGTQISSANLSNDANLAKLAASQTFTGNTNAFQNGANSTNAFNVQNAAGTRVLTVDTTSGEVELGLGSTLDGRLVFNNVSNANTVTIVPGTPSANRTITLPNDSGVVCLDTGNCAGAGSTLQTAYNFSAGGTTPKIKVDSTRLGVDIQDADATIGANLLNVRESNAGGLGQVMFGVSSTGQVVLQNGTNSTTAFRLLTDGGTAVMTGDTTNGQIILGQSSTLNGSLVFNNSTNANQITLATAVASGPQTITLPNDTGTVCLTSGNCAGVGGTGDILQGGNSFAAAMTIGTNDAFDLNLETSGVTRLTVESDGSQVTLASNVDLILQGASAYVSNPQSQTNSEAFGSGASVSAANALAVGNGASAGNVGSAVGRGAQAGLGGSAFGYNSNASGDDSVALGALSVSGSTHSIALGVGATTTSANQMVVGGSAAYINQVVIGNGVTNSSPVTTVRLQGTSATGTNVAGSNFGIAGGQSTGSAFGGSIIFAVSPSGAPGSSQNGLVDVASIGGATGAALFQNAVNSNSAFNIENAAGGNLFTVSTSNSSVGINLGSNNTPTLSDGLEINGGLRMTGANQHTFTTPNSGAIGADISMSVQNMNAFSQVLALGVDDTSASTARVISLFDDRATPHQATLAVFSPDENSIVGFNWNGSNSAALVGTSDLTTGGNTDGVILQSGNVSGGNGSSGEVIVTSGSISGGTGGSTGLLTLQSGNGAGTNSNSGNVILDAGTRTGSGTAGTITIGGTNASALTLGRSGLATLNAGTLNLGQLGTTDTAAYLCRNSSNILAACSATGAGAAFVQGGNSFGATAVLGTNDSNSLTLETNNVTQATIAVGGATTFQNSANSSNAFRVLNSGSGELLGVDTTSSILRLLNNNNAAIATGGWTANANDLASGRFDHASVVYDGYVYAIAGNDNADVPQSTVYYAKMSADGSIGAWASTTALPQAREELSAVAANGYVYAIGGRLGGSTQDSVYYAKVNADGTLGTWNTTTVLPNARANHTSVTANGYVYAIAGDSSGGEVTTVYYARLNSDGTVGAWNTTSAFATARRMQASVAANGYVYSIGGSISGVASAEVAYAKLNTDGTIGSWSTTSALPNTRINGAVGVLNGYVYHLGGDGSASDYADAYYAQLNANGTISSWTQTTDMNISRRGLTTVTRNGYIYAIGGENGSARVESEYASPARVTVGGSLDLVGLAGENLAEGGSGGHLTAGDTYVAGMLTVTDSALLKGGATVNNNLTVQSQNNSTAALSILNASGSELVGVDTSDSIIRLLGNNTAHLSGTSAGLFNTGTTLSSARGAGSNVTVNGYLYVLGGCDAGSSATTTVQYAKANSDGPMGTWATTTALPTASCGNSAATYNGYIYVHGGTSTAGTAQDIYYAKPNADGTITSWSTVDNPTNLVDHVNAGMAAYGGYLYITGGEQVSGTDLRHVYYGRIGADGSVPSFTVLSNWLPATEHVAAPAVVANGYLYVFGSANYDKIYYGKINADGSVAAYTEDTDVLPAARRYTTLAVLNGYLYAIAGGTSASTTVYYSSLNSDGSISAWAQDSTALPAARSVGMGVAPVVNGYIYYLGGGDGTFTSQNTTYYASGTRIKAGASLDLTAYSGENLAEGGSGGQLTAGNTHIAGLLTVTGNALLKDGARVSNNLTVQSSNNSTSAFAVQNAAGATLLNADTANTKLVVGGDVVASGAATATTATTSGTGTNTTTVTLSGSAFANNDVIFIDNVGQDYYTRIVSGGGTATLTVSPAVTFETGRTVTKYTVQNIGATTADYTTQGNRFFQGYFLGGVVAGAGTTTLSDGRLASTGTLNLNASGLTVQNTSNSTTAFQVQNTSSERLFNVDTTNTSLSVSSTAAAGIFGADTEYATGLDPTDVATGDLDKDGDIDMVVANNSSSANSVSVFLNNGSGTFAAKVDYSLDARAYNVALGDIDRDGDLDIVVTVQGAVNEVSRFLNNGSGTFASKADVAVDGSAYGLILGDFEFDGDLDLAVAVDVTVGSNDEASFLTNNGSGTFGSKVDVSLGLNTSPRSMTSGDFNGDGDIDVAVANFDVDTLTILSNSAGTFTATSRSSGDGPIGVAAADFDMDGDLDLTATSVNETVTPIHTNNGSGTFGVGLDYDIDFNNDVIAVDVDKDGDMDLAGTTGDLSVASVAVRVALNNGRGVFAGSMTYSAGLQSYGLAAADLDEDGDVDLAATNVDSDTVSVLLGRTLSVSPNAAPTLRIYSGGVNDALQITASNDKRLLTVDARGSMTIGGGNISNTTSSDLLTSIGEYSVGFSGAAAVVADLDEDGDTDVIADSGNSLFTVLFNNGNGSFFGRTDYTASTNPGSLVTGDFDRDGDADVASANSPTGDNASVFINNGSGTFAAQVTYAAGGNPLAIVAADFDEDGYIDLAVSNSSDNDVRILLNDGDGTFTADPTDYPVGTTPYTGMVAGDFNEDGAPDIATANNGSSNVSVLINDGDGTFATHVTYGVNSQPRNVESGDLDKDGNLDLVVTNNNSDNISVLMGNGDGTFDAKVDYTSNSGPDAIDLADMDMDGDLDAVVVAFGQTFLQVYVNDGTGVFGSRLDFKLSSINSGSALAADIDADGDPDVLTGFGSGSSAKVAVYKNNTLSDTRFKVISGDGVPGFSVNAAGTRIQIGNEGADSTAALLVLDTKDTSGDPTGVDGAMYYNSNMGVMRCYADGRWQMCNGPRSLSWGFDYQEDFITDTTEYVSGAVDIYSLMGVAGAASGTGAAVTNVDDTSGYDRPGLAFLETGTTATGWAQMYDSAFNDQFTLNGGEIFETSIRLSALSTNGVQEYNAYAGLCDSTVDCRTTNGVFFEYDSNSSANWRLRACLAGTCTTTTSTKAVVASQWMLLRIIMNSATSATFYVKNDTDTSWTNVGSVTSNIPNDSSESKTLFFEMNKTVGTTNTTMLVDYVHLRDERTTQR